jgi:HAD superfamily hydrolase (TIGR01490 family)
LIAAVFDLDGTLLPGTTAERLFVRYLVRERALGVHGLLNTIRFILTTGRSQPVMSIKRHRPYFRDHDVSLLTALGQRCVDEVIRPRLAERGLRRIRQHQSEQHATVLLSGSLPFVVLPIACALGFDHVICSELDSQRERLTGRLARLHPYGPVKAMLIRRLANEQRVDLDQSFCYADHHSDAPLLKLFGHPVCVNPDSRLRMLAEQNNWTLEEFL